MAIDNSAKRYALFDEGITKPDGTTSAFDRMAHINFYLIDGGGGVAPTDITLTGTACYTTSGLNAFIGSLTSTDVDPGDTFTYSLVAGTGSTNNASFNILGANLRCNDPLTLGAGTYSVRIRTTDSFALTYEKPFTVYVLTPSAPVSGNRGRFGNGDSIMGTFTGTKYNS